MPPRLPLCITWGRIAVSLFFPLKQTVIILSSPTSTTLSLSSRILCSFTEETSTFFFFFFFFFHFRFRFVADVRRPSASILIRRTNFTRIDPLTQSRDKRYMQGSFNWLNPHFRRALNNIFCSVCVPVHNQVRMSCCENSLVALTWYGFANATTTGP